MLLLDTCVVSEGVRPRPEAAVIAWMKHHDQDALFISAVTLGELHYGAARLPSGARRKAFESWLAEVEETFAGRILVLDDVIATRWGKLRAKYPNAAVVDSQLAATALAYGFALATRNTKDFGFESLTVINPWNP